MPNRILKESIRTSRSVNNLSDFDFRVWTYLITYVDDYGRGSADAELLKGLCFPRRKGITEAQISRAISNLAMSGMVILYTVDGEPYLAFPNWEKHQQIRSKQSKFPAPEDGVISSDSICNQMISDDCKCCRNPIQSNPNTNPNTKEKRTPAHRYGQYQNVLLTDGDMEKLRSEFPSDWQTRIERLSEYMASSGKSYKDHLATIRSWARKDPPGSDSAGKPQRPGDVKASCTLGAAELEAIHRTLREG